MESVNSGEEDFIDIYEDDSVGLVLFGKDYEFLEFVFFILKCVLDEESFGVLEIDVGSKVFDMVLLDCSDSFDKLYYSQMNNFIYDERLFIDVEEGYEEILFDIEDDKVDENELGFNFEFSECSFCYIDIN